MSRGENYWLRSQYSRRRMLGRAGLFGGGAAALLLVGCGGDDDENGDATQEPSNGSPGEASPGAGGPAGGPSGKGQIIRGKENYAGKQPVRGGTVTTAYTTDPITWDPHQTTSINTHLRTAMFNSPLLQYRHGPEYGTSDVTPSPNLADSWEQVDETTVKFTLNPKIKWTNTAPTNGRALTSEDVKFSFERILGLPAPFAGLYTEIDSIDTPDPQTVTFKTKHPYAPLLNYLAHYYGQIVPPEVVNQFGDLKTVDSAKALGIGAFELESWQPSTEMRFRRRPNYFREGEPYLDGVVLRNIPDPNATLAAARSGDIDVVGLTWENIDSVANARKDFVVNQALSCVSWLITMRSDQGPTKDERVRQALSLGIDREGWLKSLYNGEGTIDNGPIQALWSDWRLPPGKLGDGDKYLKYDPDEAQKLLGAAGVQNLTADFKFTAAYGASVAEHPELLKDLLSQMNVNLSVDIMEYGAFVGAVMNSKPTYDMMSYVGVRFMGDPDEMLWDMYHPTGSKNFAKVNDAELTTLLEKQRQTIDTAQRKQVVDDIQRYLAEKLYYIYTPSYSELSGWQPWLAGYRSHVSYDMGNNLRGVWIDPTLRG